MSPEEKADFLGRLRIFSELKEDELLDLARIAHEYEFDEGSTIAYQRDIAEEFIIVVEGRLFASQVDQGIVRDSRSYFDEEYLEDTWLFRPQAHPATVQGAEPGRLLIIRRDDFLELLSHFEYLVDYLELSDEALEVAEQMQFGGEEAAPADLSLTPEEQVLYRERRSGWRLFLEIVLPLVIFLGWTVFLLAYASL
ncbi:MAG: cyclic nucleotide-binding domain-containing protein, partial [Chloroflexota bacterium]